MKEYAEKFYKSDAWKKCRIAFIKSLPDKTCNRCKEKPGKIVHHKEEITPLNINNPMVTLNFENLEYVCQDCHNKEHHSNLAVREDVMFDSDGNLVKNIPPTKNKDVFP